MNIAHIPLTRTNLSQQIADHIEQAILSSPSIKVDEKLPSEMKLAKQYNVSRPVVREALKLLQERGLITLKNGIGAIITRPESSTVRDAVNRIMQVENISTEELTQMRQILELSSVELAVGKLTETDIRAMTQNLKQFSDTSIPLKERVKLDEQFHLLIARASRNDLLCLFIGVLTSLLREYMGKGVLIEGGIDDGIARHTQIFEAMKAGNKEAAYHAMVEHLRVSKQNVERFDEMGAMTKKQEL
jgi:GntR family transcriptional repressor for pyruvate dehydrogenase complex